MPKQFRKIEPGERFGALTVVSGGDEGYSCRCDCGKRVTRKAAQLLGSNASLRHLTSCGCLKHAIRKGLPTKARVSA
jgi:hypothetical protein